MRLLRWTSKSTRTIADELARRWPPHRSGDGGGYLTDLGYSLQANVKALAPGFASRRSSTVGPIPQTSKWKTRRGVARRRTPSAQDLSRLELHGRVTTAVMSTSFFIRPLAVGSPLRTVAPRCKASMSLWSVLIWACLAAMAAVICFLGGGSTGGVGAESRKPILRWGPNPDWK